MNRLATIAAVALLCSAGSSQAGDNNTILLIQQSPMGSTSGNTLSIDQSGADGSTVAGVGRGNPLLRGALSAIGLDSEYALQRGENNRATIKLTGTGGDLRLLQSSNPILPLGVGVSNGNNTATVVAAAFANGSVAQVGSDNSANLTLGSSATGLVTQLGSNLRTSLDVGASGTGVVTQVGTNNQTPNLVVAAGNTLAYTQIGNNITPVSPTAVEVISAFNPGTISITQTAW